MLICSHIVYCCFTLEQQNSVVATETPMARKAKKIYYLVLCRKSLLTPDLVRLRVTVGKDPKELNELLSGHI